MRTDIYDMLALARRASLRGNSMFLSIPYQMKFSKAYSGLYGTFIPEFLKSRG